MEIRHLRYCVVVAEELNFGRAAARLRVAQPGLSQQIRSLESELGLRLFDRTKRRVALTDAGSVLIAEAYATVSRFDQTLDRMREVKADSRRSTLPVAMFPNCPLGPAFVTELRQRLPQIVVSLEALASAARVHAVERGELELGVLRSVGTIMLSRHLLQPAWMWMPWSRREVLAPRWHS